MPVYPGKKWKPGDPPPVREEFANNQDYENADSEYRRWRQDQKKDASGAIVEKAPKQLGPATEQTVGAFDSNTSEFYNRKQITGDVRAEDEDAKRKAMVEASKKNAKKKKWNAEKGAFEDEPEAIDNPTEEKKEASPVMPASEKKPKKQSYIDPMTIGAPRGRA